MRSEDELEAELRRVLRGQPPARDCPSEDRWLAFAAGEAPTVEEESLREHLTGCSRCVELAQDARSFAEAMEAKSGAEGVRSGRAAPVWVWAIAASVAIAVAAGILVRRSGSPAPSATIPRQASRVSPPPAANPWSDVRIPPPPYAPKVSADEEIVFRSDEETSSAAADAFARAMEPYRSGDFVHAERNLDEFLRAHPGHSEALFYRGASLVQLGRVDEAIRSLDEARSRCAPKVCDEANWQLALVRLKKGRFQDALSNLETVANSPGDHLLEARRLRAEVAAYAGAPK